MLGPNSVGFPNQGPIRVLPGRLSVKLLKVTYNNRYQELLVIHMQN
jgi:hypothetical protein